MRGHTRPSARAYFDAGKPIGTLVQYKDKHGKVVRKTLELRKNGSPWFAPAARKNPPKPKRSAKRKKSTSSVRGKGFAKCVEVTSANGFAPSQVKKYQSRSSPPFKAASCPYFVKTGNDGELYQSVRRGSSFAWQKQHIL